MIDFSMSDEQKALQESVRRFAKNEIIPVAAHYDETEEFPMPVVKKAYEAGLMNASIPVEYGGGGLSLVDAMVLREELAYACCGIASMIMVNNFGLESICFGGTGEQVRKFVEPITRELRFAAFAITEPWAGSDVRSMRATARMVGDEYVLNASKTFITGGGVADLLTVMAYTDKEAGHKGMSIFAVPGDAPGVSIGKKIHKMGQRAANTVEVILEDVKLSRDHLIGGEGKGFPIMLKVFNRTRPCVGMMGVGVARRAMEESIRYAKERVQFGQPIIRFQLVQAMIADMGRNIEAARWLCYYSAWQEDNDIPNQLTAAYAKDLGSEIAVKAALDAIQVFGGYGYTREYPVEKLLRDAKLLQIYEGTTQIQKLAAARELAKSV